MSKTIDIKKIRANKYASKNIGTKRQAKGVWSLLNTNITFGSSLQNKVKEDFYLELHTLLKAGVDIQTALELIRTEQRRSKNRKVFDTIIHSIIGGDSLSQSMKATSSFSAYEYQSIRIGEETGRLQSVLIQLSIYFQKRIKQRRQIISAITYPIVVLLVAFGAIGFMVSFVVPMFSETFRRFGNDLPAITQAVISLSAWFKEYVGVGFLVITVFSGFCIWQRRSHWFRKYYSTFILKIPIIGTITQKVWLSRFCNTMGLLSGSQIPMLQAIQLTREMISFYPIATSLDDIEDRIMKGDALFKSLSRHSIYPKKMVSIVKVGEEINQLEPFFDRLSEQYSNDIEHRTAVMSKVLEPLIILFLGLIVGIILIAMYLPMFKLGQTF